MQSMTLKQLRTTHAVGGLVAAQIIGQGQSFVVTADARTGVRVVLVRNSDSQPRMFSDAETALKLLRNVGFVHVTAELSYWRPEQAEITSKRKAS